MQRLAFALVLVAMFGCALAGFAATQAAVRQDFSELLLRQIDEPASTSDQPVRFVVNPGESASRVAERLEVTGLIRSAFWFSIYVRIRGIGGSLEAGEYLLRPSMRPSEIAQALRHSSAQGVLVTIPEGWRAAQVADLLAERKLIAREEFMRVVHSPSFAAEFPLTQGAISLEGYLFPDTYRLLPGTPPHEIARRMVRNFSQRVPTETLARASAIGLTSHQAITLASVIEREAVVPDERPRIAGVYLNRLRKGMRLQADPTVQYAVAGIIPPLGRVYWRPIGSADLAVDSPYNTYVQTGLPPGPICNPGLDSIMAALNPEEHSYLYFVARSDGSHVFAETFEEHQRNAARYQGVGTPR